MAGADIRHFARDRRRSRRNAAVSLSSGALNGLTDALLNPVLILPLFLAQLTTSFRLVGLGTAILGGLWFLPQLLATAFVRGRRRQLPWAVGASMVRAAAVGLLAYVAVRGDRIGNDSLLRDFFVCYVAYALASGFAHVPTTNLVARAVPTNWLPRLVAQRAVVGIALAVGAGIVVRQVLRPRGPAFPRSYGLLFAAAALALVAAAYLQALTREPLRGGDPPTASLAGAARAVPRALGDSALRRFLVFRALLSVAAVADPFYVLYARREFNLPLRMVGLYVIALTLARAGSSLVWGRATARHGPKSALQVAALLRLVAPLVALTLPYVLDTSLYRDHLSDERGAIIAFGLVFVAIGSAIGTQVVGNLGYVLTAAPAERRSAYLGVTNALLAIAAFAPAAGGEVVDRSGFKALFVAATLVGLAAIVVSGALAETSIRPRPVAQAWRLRRARS